MISMVYCNSWSIYERSFMSWIYDREHTHCNIDTSEILVSYNLSKIYVILQQNFQAKKNIPR